jgi:hypothetical protein
MERCQYGVGVGKVEVPTTRALEAQYVVAQLTISCTPLSYVDTSGNARVYVVSIRSEPKVASAFVLQTFSSCHALDGSASQPAGLGRTRTILYVAFDHLAPRYWTRCILVSTLDRLHLL